MGMNFKLTYDERMSLAEVIGYITRNIGDEKTIIEYNVKFSNLELSLDDFEQLNSLYDILDNDVTYPVINKKLIKNDIELIKRILIYIDENSMFDTSYELYDILEKIS